MSKDIRAHLEGMTVADFKEHIRQTIRPGAQQITGAARANKILVRGPGDHGHQPTATEPEGN